LQQPLPSRRAHAQQQLAEADNGAGHELSLTVIAIISGRGMKCRATTAGLSSIADSFYI
jgi:hypothetical protein